MCIYYVTFLNILTLDLCDLKKGKNQQVNLPCLEDILTTGNQLSIHLQV